jgi:DNA-binding transcriptional ArsR family regulator
VSLRALIRIRIGRVASEPPILNRVGDLVLTEPRTMLALADPLRLRLFDKLRREGPLTLAALSSALDANEATVRAALREFATGGLACSERVAPDDAEVWRAAGNGLAFEIPDDAEGQAAARRLANAMLLHYSDLPRRWVEDDEPRLPIDWIRASGVLNARVALTPDELRKLQEDLERLIEPYATRAPGDVPRKAAPVQLLSYFMPKAPA